MHVQSGPIDRCIRKNYNDARRSGRGSENHSSLTCAMRFRRQILAVAILAIYVAQVVGGRSAHLWQCSAGNGSCCGEVACRLVQVSSSPTTTTVHALTTQGMSVMNGGKSSLRPAATGGTIPQRAGSARFWAGARQADGAGNRCLGGRFSGDFGCLVRLPPFSEPVWLSLSCSPRPGRKSVSLAMDLLSSMRTTCATFSSPSDLARNR